MKNIYTFVSVIFVLALTSCTKNRVSADMAANCLQNPPAWCANVRCTPDGKPVCGCDNVTYGSVCEAQCAGVTVYTMGACK